jgi:DNA-binding transcriptional regulator YiaG
MTMSHVCEKCGYDTSLHLEPVPVTGEDLKNYRHALRLSVNSFAGRFRTSRQNIAQLERLDRPLTKEEILSMDLTYFTIFAPKAK